MVKFLALILAIMALFGPVRAGEVRAKVTLSKGTILTLDNIVVGEGDTEAASMAGLYFGKQVTRTIYAGTGLSLTMVREPDLVRRNEIVLISYRLGSLTITNQGRALGAGSKNMRIKVITDGSRKVLSVRVIAAGEVAITR
ncbi:MAG: flagellar basal body P-ring formation chaperone FlgA [Parvularculaceae bacterium]